MKKCAYCKLFKEVEFFGHSKQKSDGLHSYCLACSREYNREYRENNPEKIRGIKRAYYENNCEGVRRKSRAYQAENVEKIRGRKRAYQKSRRATDPEFKVRMNLRSRIFKAIRGITKSARTFELLGMDLKEFKSYIQGQFRPGMAWENYGPVWHIDHVRPCASFDLTLPEQQKICFNWSNLQPLFAEENLRKGAK